jgi:hypothetical protein
MNERSVTCVNGHPLPEHFTHEVEGREPCTECGSTSRVFLLTTDDPVMATGQVVVLGQAVETDTAPPARALKTRTITTAADSRVFLIECLAPSGPGATRVVNVQDGSGDVVACFIADDKHDVGLALAFVMPDLLVDE